MVVAEGSSLGTLDLPLPERIPVFAEARLADHVLPAERGRATTQAEPELLEVVERRHILAVLERASGNQTLAAQLLDIGRNTPARKPKSYGLGRPAGRRGGGGASGSSWRERSLEKRRPTTKRRSPPSGFANDSLRAVRSTHWLMRGSGNCVPA